MDPRHQSPTDRVPPSPVSFFFIYIDQLSCLTRIL